jgi:peroxin-19
MEADDLDNLIADSLGGVQSALDGDRKAEKPAGGTKGWAGDAVRDMQQGPGRSDGEGNEEFFSNLTQTFQDESFQKAMTTLLQGMDTSGVEEGTSGKDAVPADAATSNDAGSEEFLQKFLKSFDDAVGSDNNFGKQLTTLMTSMMSSDLICQPLQQIVDAMEPWLKSQKGLSASDRSNYEAQLRTLKQILTVYKNSSDPLPDDKRDEVQKLLTELQDYGQPPDEVMKQIAPKDAEEGGENFEDFMKTMGLDSNLGAAEQDLLKKLAEDPEELTKVMKDMAEGLGNDEACKQQ